MLSQCLWYGIMVWYGEGIAAYNPVSCQKATHDKAIVHNCLPSIFTACGMKAAVWTILGGNNYLEHPDKEITYCLSCIVYGW